MVGSRESGADGVPPAEHAARFAAASAATAATAAAAAASAGGGASGDAAPDSAGEPPHDATAAEDALEELIARDVNGEPIPGEDDDDGGSDDSGGSDGEGAAGGGRGDGSGDEEAYASHRRAVAADAERDAEARYFDAAEEGGLPMATE